MPSGGASAAYVATSGNSSGFVLQFALRLCYVCATGCATV